MYATHFGLTTQPFSLTPDPEFLYLSPEHREALAAIQYGLLDGRGFVTLVGEAFYERISYSNLSNAGLGDLCARDTAQYVEVAVRLAADRPRRAELRRSLRSTIGASALGDAGRWARDFQDGIERVVRTAGIRT
jgi:hypothetical protein